VLWLVQMESASEDDAFGEQAKFEMAIRLLGQSNASGVINVDGWTIQLTIQAEDCVIASRLAVSRTLTASKRADLVQWPLIAVTVVHAEYATAMCHSFQASEVQ
jgi:hypothetical protein